MIGTGRMSGRGSRPDKRRQDRAQIGLKGKLFIPRRGYEEDCVVLDFSSDGAGLKTAGSTPIGTRVVLYVECFGRFEGVVIHRDRVRLGVEFQSSKAKRDRTREQLTDFVCRGTVERAPLRNTTRVRDMPPLKHFVDEDGTRIECEVVNIALGGASLKTSVRPQLGKMLAFGETAGRVLRHTEEGIAVEFVGRRSEDHGT